jgi:hypothetical protein
VRIVRIRPFDSSRGLTVCAQNLREQSMNHRRIRFLAWGITAVSALGGVLIFLDWITHLNGAPGFSGLVTQFGLLVPFLLSFLGALIVTRQRGNAVGWLMIVTGLGNVTDAVALLLRTYASAPTNITPTLWLIVWLTEISWMFPVFAFFLIPLYFPTGKPPAGRWTWIPKVTAGLMISAALVTTFSPTMTPGDGRWSIPNPIGLPSVGRLEDPFFAVFGVGVLGLVIGSAVSLFVRYRRADLETRQQIKWLLVAVGLFVAIYIPYGYLNSGESSSPWLDLGFFLTALAVPSAIAIAVFRYRLWDLDVVVNRALVYGPLTTVLAGIFAMLVALTSVLARQFFGTQSQALGAAISAVVVAVIFQPMRSRVQAFVDSRFYPEKEDLASGLVEVLPEYWAFLNDRKLLQIAQVHIQSALGIRMTAFYGAGGGSGYVLRPEGQPDKGLPMALNLSPTQEEALHRKRVVANDDGGEAAGYVPIFVDRKKVIELLGVLAIGERENGRGFSGDELKGLVELGGKIGLALNAIRLGVETKAEGARPQEESPRGLVVAESVE